MRTGDLVIDDRVTSGDRIKGLRGQVSSVQFQKGMVQSRRVGMIGGLWTLKRGGPALAVAAIWMGVVGGAVGWWLWTYESAEILAALGKKHQRPAHGHLENRRRQWSR